MKNEKWKLKNDLLIPTLLFDPVLQRLAARVAPEVLQKNSKRARLVIRTVSADMRRHQNIFQLVKFRILRQRLLFENIQRRAGDSFSLQRVDQRWLVDRVPPPD